MPEEVVEYSSHRFDDLFYAYTKLFLDRSFEDVDWPNKYLETNLRRVAAFPIDVVRPYMERMLRVHGSGPLLHTIIAANFECEPMPSNSGRFTFVVNNVQNEYMVQNYSIGLMAACGLNTRKALESVYECLRCKRYIMRPGRADGAYESLRRHVCKCEMSIDGRYLKPITDFWRKCDHDTYVDFLYKAVAETVLTKLGLLIVRPQRFNVVPIPAIMRNRRVSLLVVLQSRKRPRLDNDSLNKIVQAGYHTYPNHPRGIGCAELKKTFRDLTLSSNSDYKITCFSCHHEVVLSADFVNDPWRYHAKKSPSCKFLLMKMGIDYVKRVQESMYDFRPRNKMEPPAAVIDPESGLRPPTTPMGEFFDLCKGVTGRKKKLLRAGLSSNTVSLCTVCSYEMSNVAIMPCLHVATCVDCSFAIRDCPLCRTLITGFMMPLFQPDGSFWKQRDCLGGNYFMNLPCRHLIESCVPDNVDRCPKAYAVNEDNIYCIVCGNTNLGKLRVYV